MEEGSSATQKRKEKEAAPPKSRNGRQHHPQSEREKQHHSKEEAAPHHKRVGQQHLTSSCSKNVLHCLKVVRTLMAMYQVHRLVNEAHAELNDTGPHQSENET